MQGINALPSKIEYPPLITTYNHISFPSKIKNHIFFYLKEDKSIQQALNYGTNVIYYSPYQMQNVSNQQRINSQIIVPHQNPLVYTPKNDGQINTIPLLPIYQKQYNNKN